MLRGAVCGLPRAGVGGPKGTTMGCTHRTVRRRVWTGLLIVPALVVGFVVAVPTGPAAAATGTGVQEVRINQTGVAFGGRSFGPVGTYQQVRGTIVGAVDPADSRNAPI